jgi:hypothetical protein
MMAKPKMIRRMRMICRVLTGMLVVSIAMGAIVVDELPESRDDGCSCRRVMLRRFIECEH